VYTGFRLASPREFANVYMVGREQLVIFTVTLVAVLTTDLLMGIAIGIGVKFLIHFMNGLDLRSAFKPPLSVEAIDDKTYVIQVRSAAVFSNWIPVRRRINSLETDKDVVVDLSEALLVDHTVMEKLHEMERAFAQTQRRLTIVGLDDHLQFSEHPAAARRKTAFKKGEVA